MIARLRSALVLACLACPAGLAQAQTGADSCAAAPLVGAGVYTGTTVGATFDGPGVCGASESTPDVWFKVSPPTNRQLIVETCSGTPYDSVLSIHASCGGAVLACNDDTCNLQSRVTVQAVGGQTYWVRVSGFAGDTGSYTLTISLPEPPPPSADDCANAVLITPGSYNGTTLGSTHDGTSDCGASGESPDVWYKIVPPTDRQLVVETCGGITNYDSVLAIHSDCGAGPILACNDDSCGLQSRVQAPVSAGITYYIRVAGFAGSAGDFTISVSFTDPPPPPTNGPDVTVVDVLDVGYYASIGGINSYAVGTNSCNVGDAPVAW